MTNTPTSQVNRFRFRAWDKHPEKNCWARKGWPFTLDEVMDWEESIGIDLVYMQSTGLTDKNGKEIFEGDVLRINNDNYDPSYGCYFVGTCVVEWKGTGFVFTPVVNEMKEPRALDSSSMWHVAEGDTTEVIGNIWNNPELLPSQ